MVNGLGMGGGVGERITVTIVRAPKYNFLGIISFIIIILTIIFLIKKIRSEEGESIGIGVGI